MGIEIERKFLIDSNLWNKVEHGLGEHFAQAYLCSDSFRTVRIRTTPTQAFLTIKGRSQTGELGRLEFEYEIPLTEGQEILAKLTQKNLEKIRYRIPIAKHIWEVDVFLGENAPLIIAEIELNHELETFEKPPWILEDVSHDHRYSNSYLVEHPYSIWHSEV